MAKTDFQTTEDYLDSLADEDREPVRQMIAAIRRAVPNAEETISYQLPAFKQDGWIFYVSVAKQHYGLSCPPPFTVFDEFADQLAGYGVSKSAIRFPKTEPLPIELIEEMARYRARENRARASGAARKR